MTISEEMKAQGWIEHDGGAECPVDPNTRPAMIFDNRASGGNLWTHIPGTETLARRKWRCGSADWSRCIAYRPKTPNA